MEEKNTETEDLNISDDICDVCGCEKRKEMDCDYCIRQYALSWGL